MLKFGEKLAGARGFGTKVPRSSQARPPTPSRKTTTTEPKSSPLVRPPHSPRVGPSSPTPPTTIKRSLSSSRSPSPRRFKVESPPAACTSVSASPTTNNDNTKCDSAVEQSLPVVLAPVRKWRLVDYSDSNDE
ncbi:hypothetical protein M436DRAFT_86415 [Aureobasidium namibiae CBS 147.97]|uniref:Uncharacterized protein n=1 Tax=Aureobasidium namibiae CBS 147.97 TaxID=1043004 RepID=A0A074WET9_9PEZI|nr:uncharacterized protein M436DRAFT_86415 [Aureobasidium namibiae CBS 147.97]KEQ68407.1 hypothetical protein M436DRAFT_86415 [Aureobasidium namibiae CBS 147.97]